MTNKSTVLRGVRPYGADPVDIIVRAGVIAEIVKAGTGSGQVVEADDLIALPGFVDLHTHLREPGREDAETIDTGSRAAALGGFTAVFAMANTSPVADTAGVVEQVWHLGQATGLVDVYPVGAVTVGLGGEQLAELGAMATSPAQVRVFSDDGKCVHDAAIMRRALEYVKAFDGVIAQHAQVWELVLGGEPAHILFLPRTDPLPEEPSMGIERYIEAQNLAAKIVGTVAPDRRSPGYGLSRFQDNPRLDFTRIADAPGVHFAHARGFVAKTSLTDHAQIKALLVRAGG